MVGEAKGAGISKMQSNVSWFDYLGRSFLNNRGSLLVTASILTIVGFGLGSGLKLISDGGRERAPVEIPRVVPDHVMPEMPIDSMRPMPFLGPWAKPNYDFKNPDSSDDDERERSEEMPKNYNEDRKFRELNVAWGYKALQGLPFYMLVPKIELA
jgi:hypothetical protein